MISTVGFATTPEPDGSAEQHAELQAERLALQSALTAIGSTTQSDDLSWGPYVFMSLHTIPRFPAHTEVPMPLDVRVHPANATKAPVPPMPDVESDSAADYANWPDIDAVAAERHDGVTLRALGTGLLGVGLASFVAGWSIYGVSEIRGGYAGHELTALNITGVSLSLMATALILSDPRTPDDHLLPARSGADRRVTR